MYHFKKKTKTKKKQEQQDKTENLQTYDTTLFIGQSYFCNDGSQNFLIFQPNFNTFTTPLVLQIQSSNGIVKGVSNKKN